MEFENTIQYDSLYETHVDEMFAYGMAFGIDKETVLDAIHDVFLQIYERKDSLHIHSNAKFFFLSCLKNRLFTIKRKEIPFEPLEKINEYSFSISVSGLEEIIEEEEDRKRLTAKIESMLNRLTSKQREVVYLRYMQNLNYEEIAMLLHITPKAVRKLNYRALARMKGHYGILFLLLLSNYSFN